MSVVAVQPLEARLASDTGFLAWFRRPSKPHGRYSIAKFSALNAYEASPLRAIVLLAGTPLLPLTAAVVPSFIPLRAPALGIDANAPVFFIHILWVVGMITLGTLLHPRPALRITTTEISYTEVLVISFLSSFQVAGLVIGLAFWWRFPTPFTWVLLTPFWGVAVALSHVLVLRRRIWGRNNALRERMSSITPSISVQVSQLGLYAGLSAIFERLSTWQQVLILCFFPLYKAGMKRIIRRIGKNLDDFENEIAVSSVEISLSLYQCMILQGSQSTIATTVLIGIDLVHGVLSVRMFMDKKTSVPRHSLIATVRGIVEQDQLDEAALRKFKTRKGPGLQHKTTKSKLLGNSTHSIVPVPVPVMVKEASSTKLITRRDTKLELREDWPLSSRERVSLVVQALESLESAETILLVEYLEVAIPLVNCIFLAVASPLETARYNSKIQAFYYDSERLWAVIRSIMLYTLLQGLSIVFMHVVMRRRYHISAYRVLVFVLDRHALSLVPKLLAWLALLLHFSVVHYGVDFQFKFDASLPVPDPQT
ncbi:hypothetical protein Poli38472_011964 [Pythium oligandrum]|uniref:Uncharacterized protein n=1 Tax=Pythium oligandrum TaxID=41045 RepID=A0A8K1CR64_PYTOL|nr:hypothetical protein Poli38472_011964 [Pythium oligandrum]|eukprot:TMW66848.1 hypothetical protein Poli38472_011964 [Pythium oligandrum]